MNHIFRTTKYLSYWLDMVNEHSLHSPYLFDLYSKAVKINDVPDEEIEKLRTKLLKNDTSITYKDPGSSKRLRKRTIKDIAQNSLSDAKFSMLYLRLLKYFGIQDAIELGTSLGINTLYLAKSGSPVFTFEGVTELADLSKQNFSAQGAQNIKLIEGDIDVTLPAFLDSRKSVGFVFFDANHTYEATMQYFHICLQKANDDSIFILDDIYWSGGMNRAWQEIKEHEAVRVTLDLYRCGIVIFNRSLTVQHYALKF